MRVSDYRREIERFAGRYGLDPNLVEAIVWQESSDHTDAFRPEPAFYEKYLKGKPEWAGWIPRRIASSYGLMQVMYTTAILNGWHGAPEELFLPEVGLNAGCARLRYLLEWMQQNFPGVSRPAQRDAALAAYNGGLGGNLPSARLRNVTYAYEVNERVTQIVAQRGAQRA